jgi:hypothetical protein
MGTISFDTGRILLTFKHKQGSNENAGEESYDQTKTQLSNFLPTSRRIMQFSNGQVLEFKELHLSCYHRLMLLIILSSFIDQPSRHV